MGRKTILQSIIQKVKILMKGLGISGSPRAGKTTEGLVTTILDETGLETEFISLRDIKKFFGKDTKITPDIIPCLEKQPELIQKARTLGKTLGERLKK